MPSTTLDCATDWLMRLAFSRRVEREIEGRVRPKSVTLADHNVLATEVRDCMKPGEMQPEWYGIPLEQKIIPMSSPLAEYQFLRRFHELRLQTTLQYVTY